jgi:hypothetical protein
MMPNILPKCLTTCVDHVAPKVIFNLIGQNELKKFFKELAFLFRGFFFLSKQVAAVLTHLIFATFLPIFLFSHTKNISLLLLSFFTIFDELFRGFRQPVPIFIGKLALSFMQKKTTGSEIKICQINF